MKFYEEIEENILYTLIILELHFKAWRSTNQKYQAIVGSTSEFMSSLGWFVDEWNWIF